MKSASQQFAPVLITSLGSKNTKSCLCSSKTLKMLKAPHALLLVCLIGATEALYKQWIPDTNYENKTNWDKGDVPCGSDIVQFSAQRKVSVFVESTHAVQEMLLPVDGELILNSGAGFYVGQDPGCGASARTTFKDSDSLRWFDPALWQAAASLNDLQRGSFLFAVHEESVPCQHDDVVFKDLSSFRVDTTSSQSTVPVKSVSVLGEVFSSRSEFSQYLSSSSGQLQFHGSSAVTAGNPGCGDPTGCDCGNSVNHQRICSSVTCASSSCKMPLLPVGHCCHVCGAIITISYAEGFNLQSYRDRIKHLFLTLPQYASIQLGMSKVLKPQRLMGVIPFGTSPEIQVLIVDGETGKLSEVLAQNIINDAQSHGSNLGITKAEFQASTGNTSAPKTNAGMVVGVVFAVLVLITLILLLAVLIHKGVVHMPPVPSAPSLSFFRRNPVVGDSSGAVNRGFDNPMFDKPDMLSDIPGLYESDCNTIAMTSTGVHFVNPVYDENQSDYSV